MQKHRCGLCGSEYVKPTKFKEDYLVLEGITKHNRLEYINSLLEICPHCGLVREDIDDVMDEGKKEKFYKAIISDKYQDILKSKITPIEKKLLLHEMLLNTKVEIVEIYPDVNYIQWLYYDFFDKKEKAESYCEKAKEYLISETKNDIKDLPPTADANDVYLECNLHHNLYLIEIFRRNQEFGKALSLLKKYRFFKFDNMETTEKYWFKKEKEMCKKKNSNKL